jgi:hypothetical protein
MSKRSRFMTMACRITHGEAKRIAARLVGSAAAQVSLPEFVRQVRKGKPLIAERPAGGHPADSTEASPNTTTAVVEYEHAPWETLAEVGDHR